MPFCWCFFRSTFPDDIDALISFSFPSSSPVLLCPFVSFNYELPSTCSCQWCRYHIVVAVFFFVSQALLLPCLYLSFYVLLQAAVPLWLPSTFLDSADQSSYHRLSCLYSVLPWPAYPLPSPCDFQVHFLLTQIPDTCPVLLLSPSPANTAVMSHAAKKTFSPPSHLTSIQCNVMTMEQGKLLINRHQHPHRDVDDHHHHAMIMWRWWWSCDV